MAGKGKKPENGRDMKKWFKSSLWDKKESVKKKPVKENTNE
jgi:hypothetical protein